MSTMNFCDATERLTHAISHMGTDDLLEVFNELFPGKPATDDGSYDEGTLVKQIVVHIGEGLEPEEVVDLWNVVFPRDREVYFDEENDLLHFAEGETAS